MRYTVVMDDGQLMKVEAPTRLPTCLREYSKLCVSHRLVISSIKSSRVINGEDLRQGDWLMLFDVEYAIVWREVWPGVFLTVTRDDGSPREVICSGDDGDLKTLEFGPPLPMKTV